MATTIPVPEPPCTTDPMSATEESSARAVWAGTASTDFSTADDSPVKVDSSHSRSDTSVSRTSAGHDIAEAEVHDIPRHQPGHVHRGRMSISDRNRQVTDLRMQRLGRLLSSVLIEETKADGEHQDHADDDRATVLTDERRSKRCNDKKSQERRAHLVPEHQKGARAVRRDRVGAEFHETAGGLVTGQPGIGYRYQVTNSSTESAAASPISMVASPAAGS